MVSTPLKNQIEVLEIPISKIKVTNRMRNTSEEKISELAESIQNISLLHPITVSEKNGFYLLLSGHHRIKAFELLGRETIPATIHQGNKDIEELVECEENLVRHSLTCLDTAFHIVKREELLSSLGRRAISGDNQFKSSGGYTNEELARSIGLSRRSYAYKKSISTLHPEAVDLLNETDYADNFWDLVALTKEKDEVQVLAARLLASGKTTTFKRALTLARVKCLPFEWEGERKRLQELVGNPKSVMKWSGESSEISKLCKLVSHSDCYVAKREWGTTQSPNYSQHPDHSAHFINFYSNEGDRVLDNMAGRGTNLLVAAALGRKVVGYDLSKNNLDTIKSVALEHTNIKKEDLTLHHSCGVELKEYKDKENYFDLITFDPPYICQMENYGSDSRDLCQIKSIEEFNARMKVCLTNLKRLIKPSLWEKKEFHPIIMKVGSARRGKQGYTCMATEMEIIARQVGITLHDKVINVLDSQWIMFNKSRCLDFRYSAKVHETNLVWLKYEN